MAKIQQNNSGSYLSIDDFMILPEESELAEKRQKALGENDSDKK